MGWIKRRLPTKRWKRGALYAVSTLLVAGAADMGLVQYWRRIEISPETTRVVGPLNEAGTPDYITALNEKYGKGVTEENNAAGLLLKVMGMTASELSAPELKTDTQRKTPKAEIVDFLAWVRAAPNKEGLPSEVDAYRLEGDIRRSPWKGSEHPAWARWLDDQARGLADVRRAVERPRLYVPLGTPQTRPGDIASAINSENNLWDGERVIYGALLASAMRRAGEGDSAGFREDILAAMKLARLIGNGPMLLNVIAGHAIEGAAVRVVRVAATTPGVLSAGECRKLLAEMDAVGPIPGLVEVWDCQVRWLVLDSLCSYAKEGSAVIESPPEPTRLATIAAAILPVNFNAQMRQANGAMDECLAALRLPTYAARMARLRAIRARYASAKGLLVTDYPHLYYMPLFASIDDKAYFLYERARAEGDLARVALGLTAYRGERRAYPEKLEELKAAGILREVPRDGFSDGPLV